MCQTTYFRRNDRLFAYSWTTGVREVELPNRPMTERDAIALFNRLVELGREDEAEEFLESWCR